VLAVLLLSVSLLNYRMKYVNLYSQDNFYDAESILDEIRTGLTKDISTAVESAYKTTLEKYGSLDEAERNALYKKSFMDTVKTLAIIDSDTDLKENYDLAHLWGMVEESQRSEVSLGTVGTSKMSTASDLVTVTDASGNESVEFSASLKAAKYNSTEFNTKLVFDETNGTVTLKNLVIKYKDSKNYMTQIQTDIVLSCPDIDYLETSANPTDLFQYVFVANDETKAENGGTLNVSGSAYLGYDGATLNDLVMSVSPITDDGTTKGKLISGSTVQVNHGTNLTITDMETWVQDLYVSSANLQITSVNSGLTKTYIGDDLTLEADSTAGPNVTLAGDVKAYGSDTSDASTSSAFLINCLNAKLDMTGVSSLMIAGNAYVATKVADASGDTVEDTNTNVEMGESVSLKSDQRAYLVPSEYIAPTCSFGGKNPMTESDYTAVKNEIDLLYGSGVADSNPSVFLYDEDGKIPEALTKQGVTGATRQVYRVRVGSSVINMVYFFLTFDSSADAVKYGINNPEEESTLNARVLASSTEITYPNNVDSRYSANNYTYYYGGSVLLATGTETKFLPGLCTELSDSSYSGLANRLYGEQVSYTDQFNALRHKLVDYSDTLTSAELTKKVYQNLVQDSLDSSFDINKNILSGELKTFMNVTDAGVYVQAAVINGDCVISGDEATSTVATDSDPLGEEISYLRLVIASGNVTVKAGTSFKGLIISGGDVIFENGAAITMTASPDEVKLAMAAKDTYDAAGYTEKYMPADYMKNGSTYLDKETTHSTDTSSLRYQDCVTFNNWKKS
jgi:hypothetical protein